MATAPLRSGSVQGDAIRVTALDVNGAPQWGTSAMVQSANLVKFDFKPDLQASASIDVVNAQGAICNTYHGRDTLKRFTGALQICDLDTEMLHLLTGETIFTGAGGGEEGMQSLGYGQIGAPYGVSIEIWSKRIVGDYQAGWWHWVFTRSFWNSSDKTIDNAAMAVNLNGWLNENPNWGAGPKGDFTHDTSKFWQYMIAAALPAPLQDGYQAIAAPAFVGRTVTDGVTTISTPGVTSATANFSSLDVGHNIAGTGIPVGTTILSVQSATQATMSANATASGSALSLTLS